jgi:uncharacterized protein (DUF1800 family)
MSSLDSAVAAKLKRKLKHKPKPKAGIAAAKPRKHRLHLPPIDDAASAGVDLTSMSPAMVDRLFWRAGFGPSEADRAAWTGAAVSDAVNSLLGSASTLAGSPGTNAGKALDPTNQDTDLVLSRVDQMVRTTTPFVERMKFFWHRHFANSRDSVSPPQLLLQQNDLFQKYSDFATSPAATFSQLAHDITVNPSMLRYLTGEDNVKGAPNENYARELMELFALGVVDLNGNPNYSQGDVNGLAKAFSGWTINDTNPDAVTSQFVKDRWYDGPKVVFGGFANLDSTSGVDLVLKQPNHATFLTRKLWLEFITQPPDNATQATLNSTYLNNGTQLKPLLKYILTHPALFASLGEPDMIKPPVMYVVSVMRALGVGVTDTTAADFLDSMGQSPYFPPNVAGWEGGLAWLNTNTALARFGFAGQLLSNAKITDVGATETPAAAYSRAYSAVLEPWLAPATQAAILNYATRAGSSSSTLRIERQLMLRALMLAGPDAQVM